MLRHQRREPAALRRIKSKRFMLNSAIHHLCLLASMLLIMASSMARADTPGLGMIAVGHPMGTDIWVGTSRTADPPFEEAVLQRCQKTLGAGCFVMNRVSSGVLVIAKTESGIIWTMSGPNAEEVGRNLLPPCQQQNLECEIIRVIPVRDPGPRPKFENPVDSRTVKGLAAAIVWHAVDSPGQVRNWRLWVATGRSTTDLAVADATANCRAAVGDTRVAAHCSL